MVTMSVDNMRVSINHHTRDVTVLGGMTHKIVEGGEAEVTITCRIDLRDRDKMAELNLLNSADMRVQLYGRPAVKIGSFKDPELLPMPRAAEELDIAKLVRGNRRFTESTPDPDAPAPSSETGSW